MQTELMSRILFVLSEWGFWGEELIGPLESLSAAGFHIDFATPTGLRPTALPPSMDPASDVWRQLLFPVNDNHNSR